METHRERNHIPYVPTEGAELYPDSDGKPMAVSDLHRRILTRTLQVLDTYFEKRPEVYVSGDILMYYVEGDPRKSVSPDVLVAFGLGKKPRRTYLVWQEGKVPDFAMEFSSKGTYRNDLGHKMELYAALGIQDYFLYDAEGLYLPSSIMGFTLIDGSYVPISAGTDGGLHSTALSLDFHVGDVGLGIYDPIAGEWLQTPAESAVRRAELAETRAESAVRRAEAAETRAETAETRVETAETRAEQETLRADLETLARQKAEAELAELREEIERLKTRT
ncbi:MAG: Uma2 family endonuclease [Candidatus Poribacteria bacterium]|nr:Uma2 family endonuclease [Candidatus Poribacteria bacterium]